MKQRYKGKKVKMKDYYLKEKSKRYKEHLVMWSREWMWFARVRKGRYNIYN